MCLNKLSEECYAIASEKGFRDIPKEIGTELMLIVSELGEALEADRNRRSGMLKSFISDLHFARLTPIDFNPNSEDYDWIKNRFESTIKDTFEDELADTLIRIFDLCGYLNIDIDTHVKLKMEYNRSRIHKHGKSY